MILVRRYEDKPYGLTHPGISRGMVSHIKGHFDTTLTVHLDPWTSVGIVYRTVSDRELRRAQGVHFNQGGKMGGVAEVIGKLARR